MKAKIILVIVLTALLAIIVVQNPQVVIFRIYFWTIGISQIILVPMAVAAGFLLGYIVAASRRKKEIGRP